MGLPLEAPCALLQGQGGQQLPQEARPGRESFMDAPLRLQAESYDAFAQRLQSLGGPSTAGQLSAASVRPLAVEEELRRMSIDPEVFYGGARRLSRRSFDPDTSHDDSPDARSDRALDGAGAGLTRACRATPEAGLTIEPPGAGTSSSWLPGGEVFAPPKRGGEGDCELARPAPGAVGCGVLGLNMPRHDDEGLKDSLPFEELVDAGEGETRGGRLGHETPRGIEGMLQIDSLTDDGGEDDAFRTDLLAVDDEALLGQAAEGDEAGGGDVVEAFALDPDFDYDSAVGLASRVAEAETRGRPTEAAARDRLREAAACSQTPDVEVAAPAAEPVAA